MKRAFWLAPAAILSSCGQSFQSPLHPGGFEARNIHALFWLFTALLGTIFVFVIAMAAWPVFRRQRGSEEDTAEQRHVPSAQTEAKLTNVVSAATIVTVVLLFGFIVLSVTVGSANARPPARDRALAIEVTGYQWWWYFRYPDPDSSQIIVTANELHIPVGRPVLIHENSGDVIHSFWVPGLNGKRDLIPSRITSEWIEADQPGEYRGQCAEFCGLQHAHMAFWVIAQTPDEFEAWRKQQLSASLALADESRREGQRIFMNHACVFCHSIQGTTAAGQIGPDLTHFASRKSIAASTLANTRGNLAGWIADPQSVKPGNHMATVPLQSGEMEPLLDYLESLK